MKKLHVILLTSMVIFSFVLVQPLLAATGTILSVNADNTTGLITKDSDGSKINFEDPNFPNLGLGVGDLVTFDIKIPGPGLEVAVNIAVFVDPGKVISGTHDGDLAINKDEKVTVDGGTINGNVSVNGGELVVKDGGTVNGDIDAKNGSTLCIVGSSTIDGNISMTNSSLVATTGNNITGNVRIDGSSKVDATGNTITGNLRVDNSTNINASGNTVSGNLRIDNSATVTISGNNIDGNLKVSNGKKVDFTNNTLEGNLKSDAGSSFKVSGNNITGNVFVKDNAGVTVTGNTIEGNLKLQNNASCSQSNNTVTGNISGCGSNKTNYQSQPDLAQAGMDETPLNIAYPNPSNDMSHVRVFVSNEVQEASLEVSSIYGRSIFHQGLDTGMNEVSLQVSEWNAGIYIISIQQEGNLVKQSKLVVTK